MKTKRNDSTQRLVRTIQTGERDHHGERQPIVDGRQKCGGGWWIKRKKRGGDNY